MTKGGFAKWAPGETVSVSPVLGPEMPRSASHLNQARDGHYVRLTVDRVGRTRHVYLTPYEAMELVADLTAATQKVILE